MEMLGISEFELGTSIIKMEGSDLEKARNIIKLLKSYDIPCVIILDKDAHSTADDLKREMSSNLTNLKQVFCLKKGSIEDYYPHEIIIEVINSELSPITPIQINEVNQTLHGKQNLNQYKKLMHDHGSGDSIEFLKRALGGKGSRLMKERKMILDDELQNIFNTVKELASN